MYCCAFLPGPPWACVHACRHGLAYAKTAIEFILEHFDVRLGQSVVVQFGSGMERGGTGCEAVASVLAEGCVFRMPASGQTKLHPQSLDSPHRVALLVLLIMPI